ncbi:hypothetical protein IMSAG013_00796 [Clostridiales bacterium]|nr:hypothetical protein IMSAG013_00796 [Clostridiales bacterium]
MKTLVGFRKDQNANCLENIFLALIYRITPNCLPHIYSYCWDFGYLEKDKSSLGLSQRLSNTKDQMMQQKLLKRYHGIAIQWSEDYNLLEWMSGEFPYIICGDAFWFSWNLAYQSAHIPHYFFLTKKEDDYFIIDDPYFNLYNQILPTNVLKQSLIKVGKVSVEPSSEFIILEEFVNSLKYVIEGYDGKGDHYQIRLLAEEIYNDINLQQYLIQETEDPANSKVLITLKHIARGRIKYSKYWKNYAHIDVIHSLIGKMNEIYETWDIVVKLFIRLFFDKNEKCIRERIYEQLIKIANAEKKASQDALRECSAWIGDEV